MLTLPSEGRRITSVVFLFVLQVVTRLQLIGECHDDPLAPRIQETIIVTLKIIIFYVVSLLDIFLMF